MPAITRLQNRLQLLGPFNLFVFAPVSVMMLVADEHSVSGVYPSLASFKMRLR